MFPCVLKWSVYPGKLIPETWILRPFFWKGSLPKPFGVTSAEVVIICPGVPESWHFWVVWDGEGSVELGLKYHHLPHHLPDVYMDTKAFLVDGYGSEGTPVTIQNDCPVTMYGIQFLYTFRYLSPSLQYQIRSDRRPFQYASKLNAFWQSAFLGLKHLLRAICNMKAATVCFWVRKSHGKRLKAIFFQLNILPPLHAWYPSNSDLMVGFPCTLNKTKNTQFQQKSLPKWRVSHPLKSDPPQILEAQLSTNTHDFDLAKVVLYDLSVLKPRFNDSMSIGVAKIGTTPERENTTKKWYIEI